MTTVTIRVAPANLPDLIHNLGPNDELVIAEDNRPLAKLLPQPDVTNPGLRPPPGLGKGYITIISDDEDHLRDFAEYMP